MNLQLVATRSFIFRGRCYCSSHILHTTFFYNFPSANKSLRTCRRTETRAFDLSTSHQLSPVMHLDQIAEFFCRIVFQSNSTTVVLMLW